MLRAWPLPCVKTSTFTLSTSGFRVETVPVNVSRVRRRHLTVTESANDIVIDYEIAAALRDLALLDPDCERLVYRIRAQRHGAVLSATDEDLDELMGAVAAEANHESDRRRQKRLDAAFDVLINASARAW